MYLAKKMFCVLGVISCFHVVADDNISTPTMIQESVSGIVENYLIDEGYRFKTELCSLMTKCGSDKGNGWHNYTSLYSKLFESYVDKECNIFELGLGTNHLDVPSNMGPLGVPGASLMGWAAYFPKANIYGADIDKRILFNTSRITTYYCDQRSAESIQAMYDTESLRDVLFDIIIDDGLHVFSANYNFLIHSIDKLKKGGIYIVEDLQGENIRQFMQVAPQLQTEYDLNYIQVIMIPNTQNTADNILLVIQK